MPDWGGCVCVCVCVCVILVSLICNYYRMNISQLVKFLGLHTDIPELEMYF